MQQDTIARQALSTISVSYLYKPIKGSQEKSLFRRMTIQDPKRLKVAIIGGGPGGLSTAIALSRIPYIHVELYEQATVLREVGAGISIGPNTWNVLELLGVADSLDGGHPTSTILNL
jgi:salicylate hydroxylase